MRRLFRTTHRLVLIVAMVATALVVSAAPSAAAASCFGQAPTIYAVAGVATQGTAGNDVIMGTSGADVIYGRGGDDLICSRGGADNVRGGRGDDRINVGPGNDVARGGAGSDQIFGKRGADRLYGNGNADVLVGGGGPDRLWGGKGNDELDGNRDSDELEGGSGADRLDGGKKDDLLTGGPGKDALYGGGGADVLRGDGGTDSCYGGSGADQKISCELGSGGGSDDGGSEGGSGGGGYGFTGALGELADTIETGVIGEYGTSFPWLDQAWAHVATQGTVAISDLPGSLSGQVYSSCGYSTAALGSCDGVSMTIDVNATNSHNTIIHELAHVYERSTGIVNDPGPLGMTQLYFNVEWGNLCAPAEIFADTVLHAVKSNAWLAYYSGGCPSLAATTTTPTAEAKAVVNAMLAGQDPDWFSDTYANGTQAWAAIMGLPTGEKLRIVTNLANEFGGYCSVSNTMLAAFWGGSDTNPWADDGC